MSAGSARYPRTALPSSTTASNRLAEGATRLGTEDPHAPEATSPGCATGMVEPGAAPTGEHGSTQAREGPVGISREVAEEAAAALLTREGSAAGHPAMPHRARSAALALSPGQTSVEMTTAGAAMARGVPDSPIAVAGMAPMARGMPDSPVAAAGMAPATDERVPARAGMTPALLTETSATTAGTASPGQETVQNMDNERPGDGTPQRLAVGRAAPGTERIARCLFRPLGPTLPPPSGADTATPTTGAASGSSAGNPGRGDDPAGTAPRRRGSDTRWGAHPSLH
jgi:hypothetical protein